MQLNIYVELEGAVKNASYFSLRASQSISLKVVVVVVVVVVSVVILCENVSKT